jgi:hypothetical protein
MIKSVGRMFQDSVRGTETVMLRLLPAHLSVHHLALLHRHAHVVDTIVLQLSDAIRILMADVAAEEVVHSRAMQTLGL